MDGRVEADPCERITQPFRRSADIGGVLGASAHAGNSQQIEQLIVNASIMLIEVLVQVSHWKGGAGGRATGDR
jgi:hypothetical protein